MRRKCFDQWRKGEVLRAKRMMKSIKRIIHSRYFHLSLGLLLLYGVSWILTYTTQFEKIVDSLCRYCCADYQVNEMGSKKLVNEAQFYRGRYAERLNSLTSGLFDWNDEQQTKEFFMSKDYVYEVIDEGKRFRSYLLAPILEKGIRTTEIPQKVTFYYYILGSKEIPTFLEYLDQKNTSCLFVSAADKVNDAHPEIYIHRDSLIPVLKRYFEFLWEKQPKKSEDFYIHTRYYPYKDIATYFLYVDLRPICEDVFIKRLYRNKKEAEKYFVEEGLKVFWPTLLAMGGRMALDQDLGLQLGYRYLRALFTGLSLEPNYTMFCLSRQYYHYEPAINKIMQEFKQRCGGSDPIGVTLEQISRAAREILKKLEGG